MFYHLSYRSARERLDLLSIVREEGRDSMGLVDPSCVAVGLGTEGRSRIDGGEESDRSIVRAAGRGTEEGSRIERRAWGHRGGALTGLGEEDWGAEAPRTPRSFVRRTGWRLRRGGGHAGAGAALGREAGDRNLPQQPWRSSPGATGGPTSRAAGGHHGASVRARGRKLPHRWDWGRGVGPTRIGSGERILVPQQIWGP